ncbi:MAG: 5-carboxymethyl-2-hydroxymuconate Delta-isomerase [Flavobacteriales bacterium]|nr:5-carboxymethyl-2-hydroxymuconate Delta-isomerase [Flavobacteriales bacterium]
MPHFIVDCSESILTQKSPDEIMGLINHTAFASGLFAESGPGGIKVRLAPYKHYYTVNEKEDFIHVFAHIMEGRTDQQKRALSDMVVSALKELFPDVPVVSMNVYEFDKASYTNRNMVT